MYDYTVSKVYPQDRTTLAKVDALLEREGIRRDGNLDYTCAIQDDDLNVIATGSCFGNTLRCLAVDSSYQGEGLMINDAPDDDGLAQCREFGMGFARD